MTSRYKMYPLKRYLFDISSQNSISLNLLNLTADENTIHDVYDFLILFVWRLMIC